MIYLQQIKDPVEAYHHFRKYLELQPHSREAGLVRQQIEAAKRQFAAGLPTRPEENQAVRFEYADELGRLKRDNDELRAELATLRGGGAVPIRRSPNMLTLPENPRPRTSSPAADESPITPAPAPRAPPPIGIVLPPPGGSAATPGTPPPTRPNAAVGRTHVVEPGESTWSIARKYYGSNTTALKVQGILDANREVLRDAKDLKPGMTLRIPNP